MAEARRGLVALGLGLVLLAACTSKDPRERVLDERARWNVQLLGFVQTADGGLNLSTRLSGPPRGTLKQLSVFFRLAGADGAEIATVWHTFDLSGIERGGPEDVLIRLPDPGAAVETVGIGMALDPSPEEERHISELAL